MTSASLMHEAGHPKPALGQHRGKGWGGTWQGFQDWRDACIPTDNSC